MSKSPQGKSGVQLDLIINAFAREKITIRWAEDDQKEIDYIYQDDHLVVRDTRLAEVLDYIPREMEPQIVDGMVQGSTLVRVLAGERFPQLLDDLDQRFGLGVATPNHVIYVVPVACCPADEPDVPADSSGPHPAVCPGEGGQGIRIHVPDSGVRQDLAGHPWLDGVVGDVDTQGVPVIRSYGGHGTFIAGVARTMAPAAEVVVSESFRLAGAALEFTVVKMLDEILTDIPDIISLSAGTKSRKNLPLLAFEGFFTRLEQYKGVVMIAAAGNDGVRRPFWPAAFPQVVAVGALSADDWAQRASFSNFGGWVDVYAPGERLTNAFMDGEFTCVEPDHAGEVRHFNGMATWSGTSFATPLVAGLVASRMSHTGENGRQAASALIQYAQQHAVPGLGAVLLPCAEGGDLAQDRAPKSARQGAQEGPQEGADGR
jgi:hypothetical protein